MAAPNLSNPESLEVLTAMLNQTLIETGRFFRSGASLQSRAQLKRALPAAHEQFQSALDNLSEQIFIAKAFLERDYEVVKAKKTALRPTEHVATGESKARGGPDTVPVPEQTAGGTTPLESESKPMNHPADVQQQTDMNKDQQGATDVSLEGEKPQASSAAAPPVQGVSETEDINFDSLLNNQGPNEFDLSLDFGNDNGNDNFLSNSNFGNANTVSGVKNGNIRPEDNTASQNNNAIPTGGDAFDLELQKLSAGNTDGQFGNNTEDVMGPGESSFDDLFMESENMGGDGSGDPGMLDMNELDDSWFT